MLAFEIDNQYFDAITVNFRHSYIRWNIHIWVVWYMYFVDRGSESRISIFAIFQFVAYSYSLSMYLQFHKLLQWRHNGHDSVSNHQPNDCLLNLLFRRRSKKTSKLRVTGLCAGKSPGTGEFPVQKSSNAENVTIWWRYHVVRLIHTCCCDCILIFW